MLKIDAKFIKITYAIFAFSWFVGDYTGNWNDDYKYGFWIISALAALFPITYYALGFKREKIKWDTYLLKQVATVVGVFAVISIMATAVNGHHLFMWKDLFYLLMPALYVFEIINMDQSDDFDYYIDWIFYTFALNLVLICKVSSFTVSNFMSISFAESYSPWETGLADVFCICFFYYFMRRKWGKCALAGFFNILSFKRLDLIFMGFILLFGWFLKDKPVPRWVEYIIKVFLILSPILIYLTTEDAFANWFESAFNMDLNSFTMGRFNQINFIVDLDDNMTGLGMTHYMLVKYDFDIHRLHCDVIRILLETTALGLVVFVNGYVNIAKRNQKAFSLVVFFLIVMITSTCMENTYYWMLMYLVTESLQRIARRKEAQTACIEMIENA
ncbi:MAG: hypothetical protein II073_07830 [Lachnospiraceae bacterium]|nr:hypothetical protein [Lachnospiraceae bacterium]